MRVTVTIDCDNAAFDNCGAQLADIFQSLANRVRATPDRGDVAFDLEGHTVRETNGNTVCRVKVSDDTKE